MIAPPDKTAVPVRPTHKEHAERIAMCRGLLAKCVHDADIKRSVAAKYGISTRSVERYLRRAREQMVAETGQPREVLQAESVEFYRTICQKKDAEDRDKIKARERIDKVLGLEAPQRIAGADGGPLTLAALLVSSAEVPAAPPPTGKAPNQFDVGGYLAQLDAPQSGNGSNGNGRHT